MKDESSSGGETRPPFSERGLSNFSDKLQGERPRVSNPLPLPLPLSFLACSQYTTHPMSVALFHLPGRSDFIENCVYSDMSVSVTILSPQLCLAIVALIIVSHLWKHVCIRQVHK